jgi:hypothetical protein
MKFFASLGGGLAGFLSLVVLTSFALLRPSLSKTEKTSGLPTEYWAHGAAEWKVVPAPSGTVVGLAPVPPNRIAALRGYGDPAVFDPAKGAWADEKVEVETPLSRPQGGPTSSFWSASSPSEALAAYHDDYATGAESDECQVYVEPAHQPLPPFPAGVCERAQWGARLSTGAVLALVFDAPKKVTRAFLLEVGQTTWAPLGEVSDEARGDLRAGAGGRALIAGFGERIALFEGKAFTQLPKNVESRYGYQWALADDGSVLITGGQQDENKVKSLAFGSLPFCWFAVLIALAVVSKVKWKASLGGMMAGVGLGMVLTLVAALLILPMFAWH